MDTFLPGVRWCAGMIAMICMINDQRLFKGIHIGQPSYTVMHEVTILAAWTGRQVKSNMAFTQRHPVERHHSIALLQK
jgi:hypothetical protein